MTIATPRYVLLEGNCRIGPSVVNLRSGRECSSIYGFSNRTSYEQFRTNSESALTPYPLVTTYLRSQVDDPDAVLKLVLVDATSPDERSVQAATMEAVLKAHESLSAEVAAEHRLSFDRDANAYRVDETTAEAP